MAVLIIFICFDLVTQTCESLSRIFAENYTATQMIDFAKGDPNNDIIYSPALIDSVHQILMVAYVTN